MKTAVFICVMGILSLLSSTSSFATDVKSDHDRAADFGRYKKYCCQKVETQNPLWIERIKTALNSALAVKGLSQAESGSTCDISIVAIEIKRNHDTANTLYDTFGGVWRWRGFETDGLAKQRRQPTPIKPVLSSSICSAQKPRTSFGEGLRRTHFPTNPTRT